MGGDGNFGQKLGTEMGAAGMGPHLAQYIGSRNPGTHLAQTPTAMTTRTPFDKQGGMMSPNSMIGGMMDKLTGQSAPGSGGPPPTPGQTGRGMGAPMGMPATPPLIRTAGSQMGGQGGGLGMQPELLKALLARLGQG